jgi:hypothetical protein
MVFKQQHQEVTPRLGIFPGVQLNAEQHWPPNPPNLQDAELRPVTLDQLLSSRCTKLVVAVTSKLAGTMLLVMEQCVLDTSCPTV